MPHMLIRARARVKVGPTGIVPVPSATYRNNNYYKKICPPLTAECFCLSRTNMLVGRCSSLALALTASALFVKSGIVAGQPLLPGRAIGGRQFGEVLLELVPLHMFVFLGCPACPDRRAEWAVKSLGRANATATIEVGAHDPDAFPNGSWSQWGNTSKLAENFSGFAGAARPGECGNLWQFVGRRGATLGQTLIDAWTTRHHDSMMSISAAPHFDKMWGLLRLPAALGYQGMAWASMTKAIWTTPLFRNNATATEEASVNETVNETEPEILQLFANIEPKEEESNFTWGWFELPDPTVTSYHFELNDYVDRDPRSPSEAPSNSCPALSFAIGQICLLPVQCCHRWSLGRASFVVSLFWEGLLERSLH